MLPKPCFLQLAGICHRCEGTFADRCIAQRPGPEADRQPLDLACLAWPHFQACFELGLGTKRHKAQSILGAIRMLISCAGASIRLARDGEHEISCFQCRGSWSTSDLTRLVERADDIVLRDQSGARTLRTQRTGGNYVEPLSMSTCIRTAFCQGLT